MFSSACVSEQKSLIYRFTVSVLRAISDLRRRVNETFVSLGRYAALIGSYLTDILEKPNGPTFKNQAVVEDGTVILFRNVGK